MINEIIKSSGRTVKLILNRPFFNELCCNACRAVFQISGCSTLICTHAHHRESAASFVKMWFISMFFSLPRIPVSEKQ